MTSIAKLKDKARKHEQKEDWQAAIRAYQKVLDQQEGDDRVDLDLGLFNRIGDLNLRIGETDEAVSFYEKAADKYAESGFYNNAIALCNKALRHRPDRPAIYLKLSRLCNEQGFDTDARRWILEYAERQLDAGAVEEALTALEDFAELSDDPEVRELLAQQLAVHDRPDEAVGQLRKAYAMRVAAGDTEAAAKVAEKAHAIDPSVDLESEAPVAVPKRAPAEPSAGGSGVDEALMDEREPADVDEPVDEEPAPEPEEDAAGVEGELETTAEAGELEPDADDGLAGLETHTETVPEDEADVGGLEGFETHAADVDDEEAGAESVGEIETFEAGAEAEEAEGAEPLPLLDTGYEDEEEEPEPPPTIDSADEDEPVDEAAEVVDVEPDEAAEDVEVIGPEIEEVEADEVEADEVELETEVIEAEVAEEEVAEAEVAEAEVAEAEVAEEEVAEEEVAEEEVAEAEPVEAEEPTEEVEAAAEPAPEAVVEDADEAEVVEAEDVEAEVAKDEMDLVAGMDEEGPSEPAEGGPSDVAEPDEEGLDLSFETPVSSTEAESEPVEALDLDVGSLDLGVDTSGVGAGAAAEIDYEAVLVRAKEQVSRALIPEALQELRLLSGSDAPKEVFRDAVSVVKEILRHSPDDISALEQRVEYAEGVGEDDLMVEAYLDLAAALERAGSETKAKVMYGRVLSIDPEHEAAREAVGEPEEEGAIDLDEVLREVEPGDGAEAGEEAGEAGGETDPDFAAMLDQFKAKVTEVDPEEAGDHYDLGLAFREMGLIDEAIVEFQTALTGGEEQLKVYEELGQCFVLKGQYNVALKVFDRALKIPRADDDELLGVYYHLGQVHEELGQREEAREAYEKILAIDDSFADVPDRVAQL